MELDKRLAQESIFIRTLSLSQLRVINDGELPWFLLVPEVENAIEFTDLKFSDQQTILEEINFVTSVLKENCKYDKINIATIGNVVSQLHIHIIARSMDDRAWPNTIWGTKGRKTLDADTIAKWNLEFNK